MKGIASLTLTMLLLCGINADAAPLKPLGVVRSQFDDVEKYLKAFRVSYVTLQGRDLEDSKKLESFRAVFMPSGVEPPIETNVNVMSRGTVIQGVTLRDNYYETDTARVHGAVKRYLENGGICYFSGFSFNILQGATGCFDFFDDFPYAGMSGPVRLELDGDLRSFCATRTMEVNVPFSGWIAVKTMRGAEVIASGSFETPRGARNGPVIGIMRQGDGEACYTSIYGNEGGAGFMRFFVMKLAYRYMLEHVMDIVDRWEQVAGSRVVDVIAAGESVRRYHVPVRRGRNTVYFYSENGFFQMDMFDDKGVLIASKDEWRHDFSHSFRSGRTGHVTVRIYPSTSKRYQPYAIIGAQGARIFPHWRKAALFVIMALVVGAMIWLTGIVNPKYSGRPR